MSKNQSMCPSCSKPFTDPPGNSTPYHTVGVVRKGKVDQVQCPGVGRPLVP